MPPVVRAVTFDFGQTLVAIDPTTLVGRLAEIGIAAHEAPILGALGPAFAASDRIVQKRGATAAWHAFMDVLLAAAGVAETDRARAVPWLFEQQRVRNLWRRPIPGMIELCRDLARAGVPIGLVTNSEGRAAQLVAELGWTDVLPVVADSGILGIDKPAPEIFDWIAERLGVPLGETVHVGDSFPADVLGAVGAGMRAVWFAPEEGPPHSKVETIPDRVGVVRGAAELRAALGVLGLPLG
jgi:HAD superfamily hydrolase (TIGR01549 family)